MNPAARLTWTPPSQLAAQAAAAEDMADDPTFDADTRRAARDWADAADDYIAEMAG